ncbi:Integral membrane protein [Lasiodiplodia theobromae]|uniref:Integral membrane protein n=1 Tax=Lasiodiplodia theobromae TaxID=45133 RepID=UPI0015C2FF83|nr:Integral membrane protein [Lasiodiplodia theobromae]KAF4544400.1 Integral membrane protein [Lasiodiplodia theobromae]
MAATQPLTGAAKQHAIDTSGLIHKQQWLVASWVMCGLALLTVAARIAMRFFTRRKLFLDDYFLLVAMPCVVVATSMLQWGADGLFLYKAVISDVPFVLDAADLNELTHVTIVTNVFVDTSWTAIFCVKFSFLALFRVLIKNVSTHLSRYFWCVVVITAVTWAFLVSEAFILCSKFGWASFGCTGAGSRLYTPLTAVVTVLDITTDVLVVTFPIFILRRARIDREQKIGLGAFLSLSIVMIIFATIRVLGAIRLGEPQLDVTWELFWQLMEACAAMMAASATVFRTIFLRRSSAPVPGPGHAPLPSASDGPRSGTAPGAVVPTMTEIRSFMQREGLEDVERIG